MRECDTTQLALKPFAADGVVLVVGEDRAARAAALGGAGRLNALAMLTLFVPPGDSYAVGAHVTVNLLPAARRHEDGIHFEGGDSNRAPRIAESRVSFEGVVHATGSLDGEHARNSIVLVRILSTYQRWPRGGCAVA